MNRLINKDKLLEQKKKYIFLIGLIIVGFISGIIFLFMIKKDDKLILYEELNIFFSNIKNSKLNYLNTLCNSIFSNIISISLIFLLGISIIGIPFIILFLFYKAFALSFSIVSIIAKYKFKGLFLAFSYIFPHQLIYLLIWILITFYSLNYSIKIIDVLIFKKNINLREAFTKYTKIFLLCLISSFLCSLIETFITPHFINLFIF